MKLTSIFFVLMFALVMLGGNLKCKNKASSPPLISGKRDTTRTIVAYIGYQNRISHWGEAQRISLDTLGWVELDTANAVKKLKTFVWYEVTIPAVVDSAIHQAYNVPFLDSLGKPNTVSINQVRREYPYVRDTIFDLDSTLKFLDQFIIKDSLTIKK